MTQSKSIYNLGKTASILALVEKSCFGLQPASSSQPKGKICINKDSLDTPKRMIKRKEREKERERKKGRRIDRERERWKG